MESRCRQLKRIKERFFFIGAWTWTKNYIWIKEPIRLQIRQDKKLRQIGDTLFDTWSNSARMSHGNDLDPRSLTMEYMWGIPKNALCNRAKLWYAEFRSYRQQAEGSGRSMNHKKDSNTKQVYKFNTLRNPIIMKQKFVKDDPLQKPISGP